jgi:hypothetical protein
MRSTIIIFAMCFAASNAASTLVSECLISKNITTILNSSDFWANETTPYNLRFSWQPAVFAIPETISQVIALGANVADTYFSSCNVVKAQLTPPQLGRTK